MALVEYSVLDARMRHLVIGSAHLERLDSSSRWAEGPVYFPAGDYLLWSDIPNNRVMQWAEGMGVRCFSSFAYNCNGSTRDSRGRRITCEHLSRSVVRFMCSRWSMSDGMPPRMPVRNCTISGRGSFFFFRWCSRM